MTQTSSHSSNALLTFVLPGPDRKRTRSAYHFRCIYRNPECQKSGCVATWEVLGGRENYQISLENSEQGRLCWHCCCADSVYRQGSQQGYQCKHVRGLIQAIETINPPNRTIPTAA